MNNIKVGDIVFINKVEQYWDKPYTMKRHHVYDTRSVVLKCEVKEIKGTEFKGLLFDNNGFDKDGETFIFNEPELLSDQNFKEPAYLGVWNYKN